MTICTKAHLISESGHCRADRLRAQITDMKNMIVELQSELFAEFFFDNFKMSAKK